MSNDRQRRRTVLTDDDDAAACQRRGTTSRFSSLRGRQLSGAEAADRAQCAAPD